MRLLGAGDNVVDRYLDAGVMFPGGNAVNAAVYASRLGHSAGFLGVLGDDAAGRHVLAALTDEGVDTSLVTVAHGMNAHADVRIVGHDRVFVGADKCVAADFTPDTGQLDAMSDFDVVHTAYSGTLADSVPEMARRTRVSFDWGNRFGLEDARDMLPHLFLVTFSGSHLTPAEARSLAADAVAGGADHALVTRGSDGAFLADIDGVRHQPAAYVEAVDALGAGDAFLTRTLTGLVAGEGPETALPAAASFAADVCTWSGAFGHATALVG
jgi:fructoselysine 6-kinase